MADEWPRIRKPFIPFGDYARTVPRAVIENAIGHTLNEVRRSTR